MRKLTINGKPVAVWFDSRVDKVTALSKFCTKGYKLSRWPIPATAIIERGDSPILDMSIEEAGRILKMGLPVLFIAHEQKNRHGVDCNHHLNRIQAWRKEYPGLVAFGSRKTETWRILEEHAEAFDLLGYS